MTLEEEMAMADLIFELSAPHTQEEIAEHLGMPRETVRDIESRALAKLLSFVPPGWDASLREPSPLHVGVDRICPGDGRCWWGEDN